eukprot:scaffold1862_cov576-Prasinococcus_capsulatus_cf.AAC.8
MSPEAPTRHPLQQPGRHAAVSRTTPASRSQGRGLGQNWSPRAAAGRCHPCGQVRRWPSCSQQPSPAAALPGACIGWPARPPALRYMYAHCQHQTGWHAEAAMGRQARPPHPHPHIRRRPRPLSARLLLAAVVALCSRHIAAAAICSCQQWTPSESLPGKGCGGRSAERAI